MKIKFFKKKVVFNKERLYRIMINELIAIVVIETNYSDSAHSLYQKILEKSKKIYLQSKQK